MWYLDIYIKQNIIWILLVLAMSNTDKKDLQCHNVNEINREIMSVSGYFSDV